MKKLRKTRKPKLPTVRESLARISDSLLQIADNLKYGLYDSGNGDAVLQNIQEALWDMAEYGPGKAPKDRYDWRHSQRTEPV